MRKLTTLPIALALAVCLTGCFADAPIESGMASLAPVPITTIEPETDNNPNPQPTESMSFVPTKDDVLDARAQALEGMSPEQIKWLNTVIWAANWQLENGYLNHDIFGRLSDPNSLEWNYFDQTGEIHIGWFYDGSLDKEAVCAVEGLTEEEFYQKYGTRIVTENQYDADAFIAVLADIQSGVQNEALKADLQYIMDETELAKRTHRMEHANNIYKALHDMDYFLLRYGPEDVGRYVIGPSIAAKYYGMLSIYS